MIPVDQSYPIILFTSFHFCPCLDFSIAFLLFHFKLSCFHVHDMFVRLSPFDFALFYSLLISASSVFSFSLLYVLFSKLENLEGTQKTMFVFIYLIQGYEM